MSEVATNKTFLEVEINNKSKSKFDSNVNSNVDFESEDDNKDCIATSLPGSLISKNIANINNKFTNYRNPWA